MVTTFKEYSHSGLSKDRGWERILFHCVHWTLALAVSARSMSLFLTMFRRKVAPIILVDLATIPLKTPATPSLSRMYRSVDRAVAYSGRRPGSREACILVLMVSAAQEWRCRQFMLMSCAHWPAESIAALHSVLQMHMLPAGRLPVRMRGLQAELKHAMRQMQPMTCSRAADHTVHLLGTHMSTQVSSPAVHLWCRLSPDVH